MTGKELRKFRKSRGMTLAQLAYEMGYDTSWIWRMETGRNLVSKKVEKMVQFMKRAEK